MYEYFPVTVSCMGPFVLIKLAKGLTGPMLWTSLGCSSYGILIGVSNPMP